VTLSTGRGELALCADPIEGDDRAQLAPILGGFDVGMARLLNVWHDSLSSDSDARRRVDAVLPAPGAAAIPGVPSRHTWSPEPPYLESRAAIPGYPYPRLRSSAQGVGQRGMAAAADKRNSPTPCRRTIG
jgi:hypothetical protein